MSTGARPSSTPVRAVRALRIVAVALIAVGAAGTVAVMLWSAAGTVTAGTLVFLVWNLLPHAWALISAARVRVGRGPMTAVAAFAVGFTALDAWALSSVVTSESSTAALGFLFIPLYLLVVVGVGYAVVALLAAAERRRVRAAIR